MALSSIRAFTKEELGAPRFGVALSITCGHGPGSTSEGFLVGDGSCVGADAIRDLSWFIHANECSCTISELVDLPVVMLSCAATGICTHYT